MPTYYDIATDFDLWGVYVDPYATMTREDFDNMLLEEKIVLLRKLFGPEDQDVQEEDF